MSLCVCAKCRKPWEAPGSPARCLVCGEASFAIAIAEYRAKQHAAKKRWQDPEYRDKLSTATKKRWQDPEYQAKVSATVSAGMKKKWQDPEYRAKRSAAVKKKWQDPEYRAKQRATHVGKHLTAETKAKISAALRRRHKRGRVL